MNAKRTYTISEFGELQYVTREALAENKKILTADSEALWYVVYDTPEGEYITAQVWSMTGIQQTICTNLKYVHHYFRLEPESGN